MHLFFFFDLLCNIVDNDDAVCSSVVAGGDGSEPLLTSRVPLYWTEEEEFVTNQGKSHAAYSDVVCHSYLDVLFDARA